MNADDGLDRYYVIIPANKRAIFQGDLYAFSINCFFNFDPCFFCHVAQTTTQARPSEAALEKAKKKKELDERIVPLLDQTIVEANGLRLSNNRAVILAMSGDLYWRFDSKRSRELFRSAAAEVVNYNQDVEKEKRESTEIGIVEQFDQNDPRAEILNLISSRDADLALELMVTTRSASLSDAMARVSVADLNAPGAPVQGPHRFRAFRT